MVMRPRYRLAFTDQSIPVGSMRFPWCEHLAVARIEDGGVNIFDGLKKSTFVDGAILGIEARIINGELKNRWVRDRGGFGDKLAFAVGYIAFVEFENSDAIDTEILTDFVGCNFKDGLEIEGLTNAFGDLAE